MLLGSIDSKQISKALFEFHKELKNISKDSENPFHKSKYASLSHILNEINDLLISRNLLIEQHPCGNGETIGLITKITHVESGEWIASEFHIAPLKKDAQAIGSCLTYMRRYALTAILKLNVDDDDANSASIITFQEVKNKLSRANDAASLQNAADLIAKCDKTDVQRQELAAIYKQKINFIREQNAKKEITE